jgi:CubicO group peptidase (beta-lactamase class C family)
MVTNQTAGHKQAWGLAFMLDHARLGKGCSAGTFGHSGSTGTLCWIDPKKDVTFVLLTTKPAEHSSGTLLRPVSDRISGIAG